MHSKDTFNIYSSRFVFHGEIMEAFRQKREASKRGDTFKFFVRRVLGKPTICVARVNTP